MTLAQPVDLTVVSQTFPHLDPNGLVGRGHYLDTIDSIFANGVRAIILEGASGIGKTTLSAQYGLRHKTATFSLFIRTSNRWGYDPEVLRQDLCGQLHWVVRGADLPTSVKPDDIVLRELLFDLRKQLRRLNTTYYFIIDGINDIPEKDMGHRQVVLDLLPFDFDRCHFLLTNVGTTPLDIPASLSVKPYPLTTFSLDETRRYLTPFIPLPQLRDDLHAVSKGFPGHLASIRRSIVAGQKPEELLAFVKEQVTTIFENEWRVVKEEIREETLVLGILAHDKGVHRVTEIARVLKLDEAHLVQMLATFSFLEVAEDGVINFRSDGYRDFAANKLLRVRKEVQDALIDDLLSKPESDLAAEFLPDRLREAGRYQALLDFLSPEQLVKTLERGQSLAPVRRQVELGVEAAVSLERDADLMRFCMQSSALKDDYAIDVCRAEIEARIALDDYASALAIANSVAVKEDRLHLLAVVAKGKRLRKLLPDPELLDQIHTLYSQIEPEALAQHSGEVAADLLFAAPDLAIALMESKAELNEGKAEWSFSSMNIDTSARLSEQESDSLDAMRSQMKDPRLKQFLSSASLLMGGLSAREVLDELGRVPKPHDKIFLLRQWALRNRRKPDAGQVVDYALKLAIQTTEYTPNARDIRQIAMPLPFITDAELAQVLVRSFDAQKGSVEKYGPTVDYIRLQCLLAETEIRYDYSAARTRVLDCYYYVGSQVADLSVKAECLAYLLATFARIDKADDLERDEQLRSATESDLHACLEQLLGATAEQLRICKGAIQALATTRVDLALGIAGSLNHEARRDRAYLTLVEAAVATRRAEMPLSELPTVVDCIEDIRLRDRATLSVLARLGEDDPSPPVKFSAIEPFVMRARSIRDPLDRCRALANAYNICRADASATVETAEELLKELTAAWSAIDGAAEKISAGFGIASDLASSNPETARGYLHEAEREKADMVRQAPGATSSFLAALGIAVTAYTGLLRRSIDTDNDLERLADLIRQVPSDQKQAQIWADVAERFYVNRRRDDGHDVVSKYIRPIIDRFSGNKIGRRSDVLVIVAPALYRASSATAKEYLMTLPRQERDEALSQICRFILRKRPRSDPMEALYGHEYDISFEDVTDIFDLLAMMEMDVAIYDIVVSLVDSVDAKKHKHRFTQQQRNDICKKIEDLIAVKLPATRYIQHEGYCVVMQAQVCRLRHAHASFWDALLSRARSITNAADRTYVLCVVGAVMTDGDRSKRSAVMTEARLTLETIPAAYDRVERSRTLAQVTWGIDKTFAKGLCTNAISSMKGKESPDLVRLQRDVVDFAYRMDAEFAASLVAELDDDAARIATREAVGRRVHVLDVKRSMLDAKADDDAPDYSAASCAKAAWMSLATLNSGRSEALRPAQLRRYVRLAGSLPLQEAYPIIVYAVSSATTRYADTDQAKVFLRPIFEATLLACQMSARMTARASGVLAEPIKDLAVPSPSATAFFVKAGDRGKALGFIRVWLEQSATQYLKICDPYFGLEDLEALRLVISSNPQLRVRILTSLKHLKDQHVSLPYSESFRDHWRKFSDQDAPDTEVVVIGIRGTGASPIHDRWWLTPGGGLRIGTSYKSIGEGRDSEISVLSPLDAQINEADLNRFLDRREREHQGKKLDYDLFNL